MNYNTSVGQTEKSKEELAQGGRNFFFQMEDKEDTVAITE